MIYGHADDTYRYGDKLKLNFSSNIYAWAYLSGLKEHLMQHFEVVCHYPESEPSILEKLLAKYLGVPENTVMITSGANEAIFLIAQLYKGWASIIPFHNPPLLHMNMLARHSIILFPMIGKMSLRSCLKIESIGFVILIIQRVMYW